MFLAVEDEPGPQGHQRTVAAVFAGSARRGISSRRELPRSVCPECTYSCLEEAGATGREACLRLR